MKKIHQLSWGALFFVGLSTLISLPSFGQGMILKEFKDASQSHVGMGHGEKCGHTLLEIQQEKELGVFGTKDFFEDWITRKITEKNSKPQIMRVQAEKRVIPIVVHIIHNGTDIGVEANISDAQIFEQIRVLNEDFRRLNADAILTQAEFVPVAADANIEFVLAKQDPNGLPTTGIVRKQGPKEIYGPGDAILIGQTSQWNPEEYLNMWVVPLVSPYLGFATFPTSNLPGLNFAPSAAIRDGVTVDYLFFGTGPGTAANTNGRTTTHEVGHYLGLRHIWGDGGCEVDDFVTDTPNQDAPNNTICNDNPIRVSCENSNMIQNYMDYTPDACMNLFTKGQVERFDAVLANSPRRATLVNNRATKEPELSTRDVSILKVINPADALCQSTLTPQIEIQNRGNEFITSVAVEFKWNGRLIESKRFVTELNTTDTAILTFESLETSGEVNEFVFTIVQVNDLTDLVAANNTLTAKPVQQGQLTLPYTLSLSSLPPTWIIGNPDQSLTWEKTNITIDGNAEPALFIRHYEYEAQGQLDYFVSPQIDLTKYPNAQLVFEVAHGPFNQAGFQDELLVAIAPDCSIDFDIITPPYKKSGTRLQTSDATVDEFIPTSAAQFRTELVNLNKFKDLGKIRVAIVTKNAFGNNIFLRNIRVVPTEEFKYDLKIEEVIAPSPISAGTNAQEIVRLTNTGNLPISKFLFSRNTNNSGNRVFVGSGSSIPPGQSVNVTLAKSTTTGKNNLRFGIAEPNFDQNIPAAPQINWYNIENTARLEVPWRQNFNSSTDLSPWLAINPESDQAAWQVTAVTGATGPNNVARIEGATNGNSYWMATPSFDLSVSRQASVFFDVAAGAVNPGTTLYLLASTNQGETYKVLWSEAGTALSTVPTGNANPSTASNYERKYVNLTEYAGDGKNDIRLAFALDVFGTQNAPVYLDNMELFLSANPDPVIPAERNSVVYPNPASEFVNIAFNLPRRENVTIQIISATGAVVRELSFPNTLNQTYTFSREMFSAGLYVFKINSTSLQEIKRVLIQ
uniref:M43 family zinc metalloprotease n=3 Tax=Algoriphagus sp. TaxID=1872435 RepID=UPI0040489060